jgi:DtxR family Mn-dependent transcriptional regulator
MPQPAPFSRSTEDYLKAIYKLQAHSDAAQTSAIADLLGIAPPSVSGMIKRLAEAGLVEHVPYRGVQLTEAGRRAAVLMIRRHRIIESYLIEKLGYDWDTVHDEAERLEHAVSDRLIERMSNALGDPRYDPHGAPIPTADGVLEEPDLIPMTEVPVGAVGEVRMVGDEDPERLRFLAALGLKPGARFTVLARQPFNGPLTVRLDDGEREDEVVGYALAKSLSCTQSQA